jgi:hypothetical protein
MLRRSPSKEDLLEAAAVEVQEASFVLDVELRGPVASSALSAEGLCKSFEASFKEALGSAWTSVTDSTETATGTNCLRIVPT